VDEGSSTRAARRVGITQPSLSQHIQVELLRAERRPEPRGAVSIRV